MNAPDTRTQVERRAQPVILDGLHAAQAQPGSITMVEIAEHVSKALADAGLLADTRPAEPAQGVIVCTNCDADDLGCTACGAHGTLTAPQPHADTVETVQRCPSCRHAPHGGLRFCPNLASDNDCSCTFREVVS